MRTCYLTHIIDDTNPRGWKIVFTRRYPYNCKTCLSPFTCSRLGVVDNSSCDFGISKKDLLRSYRLRRTPQHCIHYRIRLRKLRKTHQTITHQLTIFD